LARGVVLSLFLHGQVLAPLLVATFVLAHREEAQKAEEVDVAFEDVKPEELPHDLPPLDDTPPPDPRAKTKDKREKVRDAAAPKKIEPPPKPPKPIDAPVKKPVPDVPQVPVPAAPPPPATPPPPPPPPKLHEKIVDLDNAKEVEAPKDAKYLAQKNNRADIETRSDRTNLEREQKGGEGSASDEPAAAARDKQAPGESKDKIAQLEDLKSKAGKSAPEVTPHKDPDSAPAPDDNPTQAPALSMRKNTPRGHEITPETVDPSLPHDPAGILATARRHGSFHDDEADREQVRSGKKMKLALSGKDYEYLFGSESKADRQLAQKTRSTRSGKFAKRTAQIRSALENFLPEVRPGNQTALNTRAAPFAEFIARMHRNIHALWGFGVLEEWDDLPRSSPLNNDTLLTTLEIVLARDGTIDKVSVVQASGYVAYDAAAVDVVYSAGPYPEPPSVIRSANGKIYIHWRFFRDGRQCATSGVDYFILNNAESGRADRRGDGNPSRPAQTGTSSSAGSPGKSSPPSEASSSPTPSPSSVEPPSSSAPGGQATATSNSPEPQPDQSAGFQIARHWFSDYVRGDLNGLTSAAIFPFRTSLNGAAKSRGELSDMLRNLLAESPGRSLSRVSLETGAGLRRQIGKLPPGLDDGSGALFAVAETDGDTLILILKKTPRGWQPQGLIRR
jgi:TonB family protein